MKKLLTTFALFFFLVSLWGRTPVVTLNSITPVQVTICQEDLPYAFNNQLLTDPGTYWDTLQTSSGADSIIQLSLLVKCCQSPANTPNFADLCAQAPLLCASYMDTTPFDLSNSTADVPGNLASQFCFPVDHSRWLRFSACASTLMLELSIQNCSGVDPQQNGVEMALFTSADCVNFTRLGACYQTFLADTDTLQFNGLTPGAEYYLFADGIGPDVCSFRLKVIQGVNTAIPDNYITSGTAADGGIAGDNDVCAGETVTYSIIPPQCQLTIPIFSCPPPDGACGFCGTVFIVDSVSYKWHIPECARFLGDSTGLDVTVIYDQCIFDSDTVVVQQVWVEVIQHYSDTSFVQKDTLVFCDCYGGGSTCGSIPPLNVSIHFNVEEVFLEIPCVGPPPEFMGVPYPSPGTFYKYDAPSCTLFKIIVTQGQGPELQVFPGAEITCSYFPSLNADSPAPVSWQTPWGQTVDNGSIAYNPGVYVATAMAANGCISTASTFVSMNTVPPIAMAGPDFSVCAEEQPAQISVLYSAWNYYYNWSTGATGPSISAVHSVGTATYTVTVTDVINGCTSTDQVAVTYKAPIITNLGTHKLCPGECFLVGGEQFCTPNDVGNFLVTLSSFNGCDSMVQFSLDLILPNTVNLGQIALLSCAVPTVTIHGINYSQPGTYTYQVDACTTEKFSIGQEQAPPPTILPAISICPGECFTFNDQTVCPVPGDAAPSMLLQADNGCDSIVKQPFMFHPPDIVQAGLVAMLTCAAPTAVVHGTSYAQPGTYTFIVDPCTVEQFSIGQDNQPPAPTMLQTISICPGECFTFNGQTVCPLPGDAAPSMQLQASNGCDSIVLQPFAFQAPDTVQAGQVAMLTCAVPTAVVHGANYSQPGTYTFIVDPCTVEQFSIGQDNQPPAPTMLQTISICPGECFTFNGQTVCPMPGDAAPTMQLQAGNGCDSIVLQPFVFHAPDTVQLGQVAVLTCSAPIAVVNGKHYSQAGSYACQVDPCTIQKFSIGEDNQVPAPTFLQIISLCPGECFVFNGQTVCPVPGETAPYMQLQAANGCDSVVFQPFVFHAPDTVQAGQVAILTCAAPAAVVHGISYSQPGTYTFIVDPCTVEQFSIGQDNQPPAPTMLQAISICPGECFTFNGQTVCPVPGDAAPSMQLQAGNGCDSLVLQPFEFNAPDTVQLGQVALLTCAVPTASVHGISYSQPGTYATKIDPCTYEQFSIAADMSPALTELPVLQICPGECIQFDGVSFCPEPGDPPLQKVLQTTAGCDSLVLQAFVMKEPDTLSLGTVATLDCGNTPVLHNGVSYSKEGVYFQQMNPCVYERFYIAKSPENCLDVYAPTAIKEEQGSVNNWFTLYTNSESDIKINYLRIYDRWGNLVFQNTDFAPNVPESGWNGLCGGKKCLPGVYVYTYELLLPDGTRRVKSGDFTLVR